MLVAINAQEDTQTIGDKGIVAKNAAHRVSNTGITGNLGKQANSAASGSQGKSNCAPMLNLFVLVADPPDQQSAQPG